jgi:hypothetical protein
MSEHGADHDRIARRAYAIYEARGGKDGLAEEDWLRAEAELTGEKHAGNAALGHEVIPHGRAPEPEESPARADTPGGTVE